MSNETQTVKPVIVSETCKKSGPFLTKTIVTKLPNEVVGPCYALVPKWTVIIGIIVFLFAMVFLTIAIIVALSPRPGLLDESCAGRSCLSSTGLKCINNTCQCQSNQYYATKCIDKKDYKQACSATVPCKDHVNLVCLSGLCQCNSSFYWNNSACAPKGTYKQSCKSDTQCLTSLALNCDVPSKQCTCNSSRYWDGVACTLKRTINETCSASSECLSSQNLVCSGRICTCSTFVYQYWHSSYKMCINRVSENGSCSETLQCFSPMTCSSGACKCTIQSYQYYDNSTLSCVNQRNFSGQCVEDRNCRVDRGLECRSGTCQCAATTPDWIVIWSKCIKVQTYLASCTDNVECDSNLGLKCNTGGSSGSCDCPYSTSNQCDCVRVNNNENYWNGSSCIPAGSFGQTCIANTNYTCQTITQKTMCNSTGYCSCGTNGGLKSSSQECVSCGIDWYYLNEMCYRIETNPDDSNTDGSGGNVFSSCNVNVPSSGQSSISLVKLNNQAVKDYFDSISVQGEKYWVDLHKEDCGNSDNYECYQSCNDNCGSSSNNWIVFASYNSGAQQMCNYPSSWESCGYYIPDSSGGCYGDADCDDNLKYFCQYKAV